MTKNSTDKTHAELVEHENSRSTCAAVSQLNSLNLVKGHHKYRLTEKAC